MTRFAPAALRALAKSGASTAPAVPGSAAFSSLSSVATATAGIIVGGITLTGLGLRMTEFVEFVSQGNVIAMLLFIAFVCLVLGLGVPTTANYVLVATLMAFLLPCHSAKRFSNSIPLRPVQ